MNKEEALKQALEALQHLKHNAEKSGANMGLALVVAEDTITAIKQALAAPVQQKPLFADIIAKHPGLAEELKEMDAAPAQPAPVQEPVAAKDWEGAEYWMPLAWELCADECVEEACTELIWEGGPIPEPWGDRWMKYEDEAKRLIALVQKHTTLPAAQRQWVGLTPEETLEEAHKEEQVSGFIHGASWATFKLKEKNTP